MNDTTITGAEFAEILNIHPATVDEDFSRDSDFIACMVDRGDLSAVEEGIPEPERGWIIGRRDLARSWGLNPDTLSKWLDLGLAAAIVEKGPRGRQLFDRRLAERWKAAHDTGDQLTLRDMTTCARRGWPALHMLIPLRVAAAIRDEVGEDRFPDVFAACLGWNLADESEPPTVVDGICVARTLRGDQCKNAAGPDGYCHVTSHTSAKSAD